MSDKTETLRELFLDVAEEPTVTDEQTGDVSHAPAEADRTALVEALPAGDHAVLKEALEGAGDTADAGTGAAGTDKA